MLVDGRPPGIYALFAFTVAGVLAWLLVPFAERFARRIGAMDVPNDRSLHDVPTPKLGGLAILVGALVAGVLFLPVGAPDPRDPRRRRGDLPGWACWTTYSTSPPA